jgi:hypothetical protein
MSTINTILIKRRLASSGLDSLPVLSGGELAFSEKNNTLYYGSATGSLEIGGDGAFVSRTLSQAISGDKTLLGLTTLSAVTFSPNSVIDLGSNLITNVLNPISDQDAATKKYVDDLGASGGSATTALSSHVDTYFVEKIESDAVVLNGGLTVYTGISSDTINTSGNVEIGGNLTVTGDFTVLGDISTLETTTSVTSSFSVINAGSTTALVVNQTGATNIAEFQDDGATAFIIVDGGNVGVGTATPNEKLTVVGNISATGTIYAAGGMSVDGGGANTTLYVEDGKVGINTETPNEALTIFGNISASQNIFAVNGDFTGTLDADGATTLGSTLYVTNAATFASSVSAAGALTVDGSATFNNDVTVVDKLQVQSTNFDLGIAGTHVDILGSDVKVVDDVQLADTTYGLDGITASNLVGNYTITTTGLPLGPGQNIVIDSNGSTNDIDLLAANVNISGNTVVTGTITGTSGVSELVDFLIDGGSF